MDLPLNQAAGKNYAWKTESHCTAMPSHSSHLYLFICLSPLPCLEMKITQVSRHLSDCGSGGDGRVVNDGVDHEGLNELLEL